MNYDKEQQRIISNWKNSAKFKQLQQQKKLQMLKKLEIFEDIVNRYRSIEYREELIDEMVQHQVLQEEEDPAQLYLGRVFVVNDDQNIKVQLIQDIAKLTAALFLAVDIEDYELASEIKNIQSNYIKITLQLGEMLNIHLQKLIDEVTTTQTEMWQKKHH